MIDPAAANKYAKALNHVAAIGLESGVPNFASARHSIMNAFKNLAGVSFETGYSFAQAEALKNAAAAAPAAGGAPAEAAPQEEEAPKEEDAGGFTGGNVFGDDDEEDY